MGVAIAAVDRILGRTYAPTRLGNLRAPLAELVFILLSAQTEEYNYRRTFRALRRRYPTWRTVLDAGEAAVYDVIRPGGLGRKKARQIVLLFAELRRRHPRGRVALPALRRFDDATAERYLMSLPGVGIKTARCVLLYSLDRAAFPVDTHTWRVLRRLGVVHGPTRPAGRDQRALQEAIPAGMRYRLHVNLVLHGRAVCTAARPRCGACPLARLCPSAQPPR